MVILFNWSFLDKCIYLLASAENQRIHTPTQQAEIEDFVIPRLRDVTENMGFAYDILKHIMRAVCVQYHIWCKMISISY